MTLFLEKLIVDDFIHRLFPFFEEQPSFITFLKEQIHPRFLSFLYRNCLSANLTIFLVLVIFPYKFKIIFLFVQLSVRSFKCFGGDDAANVEYLQKAADDANNDGDEDENVDNSG